MPSLNELKELYLAYKNGKVGGTWHTVNTASLTGGQVDYYWSSSEYDENSAWAISFNNGWAGGNSRVGTGYDYVRPLRSF